MRTSQPDGTRTEQVRTFDTFLAGLEALRDWLTGQGVSQVAMEATGSYWRPVWYVLEDAELEVLLCNARHVKNVPGPQDRRRRRRLARAAAGGRAAARLVRAAAGDP